ncbi:MAG: hypothetical protein EA422_08110 [Gemmatimonadales bacterium]|nr:MAG: hypothetical protein EA422_08110 [Gemmatimonadales bacterium]
MRTIFALIPSHLDCTQARGLGRKLALLLSLSVGLGLLLAPATSEAQQTPPAAAATPDPGRFGVGFQSSWPAYGLSGTYAVNERVTAQGVVGAFGSLTTLSGRGLYHFQKQEKYSLYGFGTAGIWRHSFQFLGGSESETSPGLGGGAGIELDWRRLLDTGGDGSGFPPLFSTIDLGFVAASFDNYNFSGLVIGAGIHYRF